MPSFGRILQHLVFHPGVTAIGLWYTQGLVPMTPLPILMVPAALMSSSVSAKAANGRGYRHRRASPPSASIWRREIVKSHDFPLFVFSLSATRKFSARFFFFAVGHRPRGRCLICCDL